MVLMDTSAIIDIGRGNKRAVAVATKRENEGDKLLASSISVFELSAVCHAGLDEKRKKLLEPIRVILLSSEHAEAAGVIYRNLRGRGEDIGAFDSLIAATALCEDEPLLTSNVKHFGRVEGLKLITY